MIYKDYKAAQLRYLVCWCNDDYDAMIKELGLNQLDIPLQSLLGDKTLKIMYSDKLNNLDKDKSSSQHLVQRM